LFIIGWYHILNERGTPPKQKERKNMKTIKRYQVRTKEYEKKNWKVVDSFDTMKEATRCAIQMEYSMRKTEHMFDSWEVKDSVTKERLIIAE
jgi:hypothetical protein